jgi:three-Cys-motif partner protein
MGSWNGRVVYIDGFAGPGKYSLGEDGSPVVVLKAARDHTYPMKAELVCVFVEDNLERCAHLKNVLGELTPPLPSRIRWEVICGRFDEHLSSTLDLIESQGKNLAPAFVFIDPFGFSHTPFKTVKRILGNRRCEVLVNFMYEDTTVRLTANLLPATL